MKLRAKFGKIRESFKTRSPTRASTSSFAPKFLLPIICANTIQIWRLHRTRYRFTRSLVCSFCRSNTLFKNTKLTFRRPQKHLRRCHPSLPQLSQIQTIPHSHRYPSSSRLHCFYNLRRNLLLGLQARLRQYKILHGNRSSNLYHPQRSPYLLDLLR